MKLSVFVRSAILTVSAVIGSICLVIALLSLIFGIRPAIVVSGSMSPAIPTGSLIFAQETPADELRVEDVVTVERPDDRGLVTHRVVEVDTSTTPTQLVLKGDANETNDPLPYQVNTAGKVVFAVPYLGTIARFFQTPLGLASLVLATLGIVAAFLWNPRSRSSQQKPHHVDADGSPPGENVTGTEPMTDANSHATARKASMSATITMGAPGGSVSADGPASGTQAKTPQLSTSADSSSTSQEDIEQQLPAGSSGFEWPQLPGKEPWSDLKPDEVEHESARSSEPARPDSATAGKDELRQEAASDDALAATDVQQPRRLRPAEHSAKQAEPLESPTRPAHEPSSLPEELGASSETRSPVNKSTESSPEKDGTEVGIKPRGQAKTPPATTASVNETEQSRETMQQREQAKQTPREETKQPRDMKEHDETRRPGTMEQTAMTEQTDATKPADAGLEKEDSVHKPAAAKSEGSAEGVVSVVAERHIPSQATSRTPQESTAQANHTDTAQATEASKQDDPSTIPAQGRSPVDATEPAAFVPTPAFPSRRSQRR